MNELDFTKLEQTRDLVLSQSQQITVKDAETETQAAMMLALVRTKLKEMDTERKFYTTPLDESKNRIMAKFKELTEPLKEIEVKIGAALSFYRMKVERERIEREAKLQAREDKKFEKQIEKGKTPLVPEPLQIHIEAQPKTVTTEAGKVTYTETWKADWEHIEFDKVPKVFNGVQILEINRVAVNRLINAGIRDIPGIPVVKDVQMRVR